MTANALQGICSIAKVMPRTKNSGISQRMGRMNNTCRSKARLLETKKSETTFVKSSSMFTGRMQQRKRMHNSMMAPNASSDGAPVKESAAQGDMVQVHFVGKMEDGSLFQDTTSGKPVSFQVGSGTVMPGMEAAVVDMKVGETKAVELNAADAFGDYDSEMLMEIPIAMLPEGVDVGAFVQLPGGVVARCTMINEEQFNLDANHALAGKSVSLDVTLVSAVDPTNRFPLKKTAEEWKDQLEEFEYHVIREKGTETAFSGEYDTMYPTSGFFSCRACSAPLYSAQSKFDSGCGWPAFDKCFAGSVATERDTSYGMKVLEIMCANCGGHLGHVFENEGKTPTNERHCVNSVSVKFVDEDIHDGLVEEKVV